MGNNSWQEAADSPATKLGTGGQKQLGTKNSFDRLRTSRNEAPRSHSAKRIAHSEKAKTIG